MEDVLPPVDPAGTPKAVNPLAFRLVQAGLTEAQPTVELILKAYRQLLYIDFFFCKKKKSSLSDHEISFSIPFWKQNLNLCKAIFVEFLSSKLP